MLYCRQFGGLIRCELACQKAGLKMSIQGLRRESVVLSSILGSHRGPNLAGHKAGGEHVPPGAEARKCCTVVNFTNRSKSAFDMSAEGLRREGVVLSSILVLHGGAS